MANRNPDEAPFEAAGTDEAMRPLKIMTLGEKLFYL
jgi:hypothetical protein